MCKLYIRITWKQKQRQFPLFDKQFQLLFHVIFASVTLANCRISFQNPIDKLFLQCGVLLSPRDFLTSLDVAASWCQVHLCFDSGCTIWLMRFQSLQAAFSISPYTHLQQHECPHCLVVSLTLFECKHAWSYESSPRNHTVTISCCIIETLLLHVA